MCLATVYLSNRQGVICDEAECAGVARMERREDHWVLADSLGKSECIRASVRRIDFVEHTVLLQIEGRTASPIS